MMTRVLLVALVIISSVYAVDPLIEELAAQISEANLKESIQTLVNFKTRNSLSEQGSATVGVGAARGWIKTQFEAYAKVSDGRMTVAYDTFIATGSGLPHPVEMRNVIATLKGEDDPERILIVSGHYDSRASNNLDGTTDAPGADDDASGVALVLETARILANQQFGATILFVAYCGEEQGLFGSKNLASIALKNKWNVEAVLNNDIVGSSGPSSQTNITDNTHVRIFSKSGTGKKMIAISDCWPASYVENLESVLVLRQDRINRGGDQNPFADAGLSAVRMTEMNENFYHQHQDVRVVDDIDYSYLARVTAVNLVALATLGLAPSPPLNVAIANKSLTWVAPLQGSSVVGYNVLWRQTYESDWTGSVFTTQTSVYTTTYSRCKPLMQLAIQACLY